MYVYVSMHGLLFMHGHMHVYVGMNTFMYINQCFFSVGTPFPHPFFPDRLLVYFLIETQYELDNYYHVGFWSEVHIIEAT